MTDLAVALAVWIAAGLIAARITGLNRLEEDDE